MLFTEAELERLAAYLGLDVRECAERHFELAEDRRHLRLRFERKGACPFLTDRGCGIYEARPEQCRDFPYSWTREEGELMRSCRLFQEIIARNNLTWKDLQNEKDRTRTD